MLQRNKLTMAIYYGCREHHETEGIHYYVLFNLGNQLTWSFQYSQLRLNVRNNK